MQNKRLEANDISQKVFLLQTTQMFIYIHLIMSKRKYATTDKETNQHIATNQHLLNKIPA